MSAPRFASTVTELLALEPTGDDTFTNPFVTDDTFRMYGGLVAGLSARAACETVGEGFVPHAVQVSFVHAGDCARRVELSVERDRDSRSFATRRVTATQDGKMLAHVIVSFQVPEEGRDHQLVPAPTTDSPDVLPGFMVPRLFSMEGRLPVEQQDFTDWPPRFWIRCTDDIDPEDAQLQACLIVYLSDTSTGLSPLSDEDWSYGPTLNHTVWIHRPTRMDEWHLLDQAPVSSGGGRGFYTATVTTLGGELVATISQEALFRARDRHPRTPITLLTDALSTHALTAPA